MSIPIDDVYDINAIAKELEDVASNFFALGCALRIKPSQMTTVEKECRYDHRRGLWEVVSLFVNQIYNVKKLGPPTWRKIVTAVSDSMGGCNHALAKKIAYTHRCK